MRALPDGPDLVWEQAEVLQFWEEEGCSSRSAEAARASSTLFRPGSRSRSRRNGPLSPPAASEADEVTAFVRTRMV